MRQKSILLAVVLALFTITLATAKTYGISFTSPAKVGSVQLKPGDYKLTVEGNKATFTNVKSREAYTTDTKVENSAKSFEDTKVDTKTDGGTTVVTDIEVGGSKLKLDF
jgi:hypothetical protein